ncbi:MAG: hypothetical protein J5486_04145 [Bacteroidaceae bacterium]|nr:hypothetical protein [Bacteroidaceae bacterium]
MIRLEITDTTTGELFVPHLRNDLAFEMLRENPLFTLRGDYTYDIDISLRDPHNRAIYQHIDRLTATSRPQNRRARLICDGRVVCDGTEVILKLEGDTLKVQILAGNSEMNYLTADDNLRIREMDFGTIPKPTTAKAQEVANKCYPDADYVFPVIYKNDEWGLNNDISHSDGDTPVYPEDATLWPQPFVLYYVEKFITLLGFSVGRNALLQDNRWKRLVLISGYETLEYAKMLPDWSASEFLENIEQFFNCILVVNHLTKVVDIYNLQNWYARQTAIELEDAIIEDEFEREYDNASSVFRNNYRNVSYVLPGGDYWKYAHLNEEVEKHCQHISARPQEAAQIGDVTWKVFTDPDYGFQFIRLREETEGGYRVYSKMVNQFAPYITDSGADNTEMKIVPAEIHLDYIQIYAPGDNPAFPNYGYSLSARPQYYEQADSTDFQAAVINGINDNAGSVMQVAFYAGMLGVRVPSLGGTAYFTDYKRPMCFAQRYYLEFGFMTLTEEEVPGFSTMTMELNGEYGQAASDFSQKDYVDTNQQHTIRFRTAAMLDPTLQYLIHGRLFVCQQLKYRFADGRQYPIVEGVFYPYI